MNHSTIKFSTKGEKFYDITQGVLEKSETIIASSSVKSGILHLFCPHTSCALTITEAFDPSAVSDMSKFMSYTAPRNLNFLKHTTEGPDDSPSHIKSILLCPSLQLIVEEEKIVLGRWQGIFLCEFRDEPHEREIKLKYVRDYD